MAELKKSDYLKRLDGVDMQAAEELTELLSRLASNPPLACKPFTTMDESPYEHALWLLAGESYSGDGRTAKGSAVILMDDRGWLYRLLRRWNRVREGKRISRYKLRRIYSEDLSNEDIRDVTMQVNQMLRSENFRKGKPRS